DRGPRRAALPLAPAAPRRAGAPVILGFEGLGFSYGAARVLEGVSAEVREGEFFGILGPNGSGKSTLLKLAAGLLRPQDGRVLLRGRDVASLGGRERAREVAFLAQDA